MTPVDLQAEIGKFNTYKLRDMETIKWISITKLKQSL
jgi:hypothetical protein